MFILLTGISGSGKSRYAKHLEHELGFYKIDTDTNDTMRNEAVFSNGGFVRRRLSEHHRVVMEWGFFPQYLPHVLSMKDQGAKLLWFKADLAVARKMYSKAHPKDPNCVFWDAQIQRITEACLPTSDFQVVDTFQNGHFRLLEDLDQEIFRGFPRSSALWIPIEEPKSFGMIPDPPSCYRVTCEPLALTRASTNYQVVHLISLDVRSV